DYPSFQHDYGRHHFLSRYHQQSYRTVSLAFREVSRDSPLFLSASAFESATPLPRNEAVGIPALLPCSLHSTPFDMVNSMARHVLSYSQIYFRFYLFLLRKLLETIAH